MAFVAAFAPRSAFSLLSIQQKRFSISNAWPTKDVSSHMLGGITPAMPTARLGGLSTKVLVPTRVVNRGNICCLLKRNHLIHDAREFLVPLSGFRGISCRNARGHVRSDKADDSYELHKVWSSQTSLGSCDPSKCQLSLAADMEFYPSEPSENDSDGAQTRGSLFESPGHLEELDLPDETKNFIRVLTNPYEGSLVYLIGTAHVSRASEDDVYSLIEEVQPEVVAVEVRALHSFF